MALIGLDSKYTEEQMQDMAKRVNDKIGGSDDDTDDKAKLNIAIAEYNGIEVLDLLNSHNYEVLKKEYNENLFSKAIEACEDEGFTHKEACGIIATVTGLIK